MSIISEQPTQMEGVPTGPFPFVDKVGFITEIEPDGSVESDRQPEVNEFDD